MKSSIKMRWFNNFFITTFFVLLIMACTVVWSLYYRYSTIADKVISSSSTPSVVTYFSENSDEKNFRNVAKKFVEDFEYKDQIEIWVIDRYGNVIASSGGFSVVQKKDDWQDYNLALSSSDNKAFCDFKMPSGEKVTAMCHILKDDDGVIYGALRYITSTSDVYNQLILFVFVIILTFAILILLIGNSGLYFVESIVNPVSKICATTREIAKGNFEVRIKNDYNDEIDELCTSINDMALQLSQIDKIKNEFISTVSHEIRTPLTAIKGWGETLSNYSDDKDLTKKGLEVIIDETDRLSGIVEQLLDFSFIQNKNINLKFDKVDVSALIEKVIDIYKQKTLEEKINISLEKSDTTFVVSGDENRLMQVFINIIDNAVKYIGNGSDIKISVSKQSDKIRILFCDDGSGIAAKDLMHIKEKFYKANNTVRGTGIGLSVCDEIIKLHGGELNIYSQVGKGTKVEIFLSLYPKEE